MQETTFYNSTALKSNRDDWRTPQDLFTTLDKEFMFDLDAAADQHNALCYHYFSQQDSAFDNEWYVTDPGCRAFCNPPYSRKVKEWLVRGYEQSKKHDMIVVFLVPARTDTTWWHDVVMKHAYEIRLVKGRIKFGLPDVKLEPCPFPSAVVVFNEDMRQQVGLRIYGIDTKGNKL